MLTTTSKSTGVALFAVIDTMAEHEYEWGEQCIYFDKGCILMG
jgi:hypothetical protein